MSARDCIECPRGRRVSRVTDSRVYRDGRWSGNAYRMRECISCGARWSTIEVRRDAFVDLPSGAIVMTNKEVAAAAKQLGELQALAESVAKLILKGAKK